MRLGYTIAECVLEEEAYLKNDSRDSLVNPRTTSALRTKHCSLLSLVVSR